mmetsp:Transcript_146733/g.470876  ORF Transcript_146733/g.470876 Transcript_146733/m.470876 type:complete len:224 (-) Transcript_146733:691-1362(-)
MPSSRRERPGRRSLRPSPRWAWSAWPRPPRPCTRGFSSCFCTGWPSTSWAASSPRAPRRPARRGRLTAPERRTMMGRTRPFCRRWTTFRRPGASRSARPCGRRYRSASSAPSSRPRWPSTARVCRSSSRIAVGRPTADLSATPERGRCCCRTAWTAVRRRSSGERSSGCWTRPGITSTRRSSCRSFRPALHRAQSFWRRPWCWRSPGLQVAKARGLWRSSTPP